MSIRIQWRRGTAAKWTSANPTLANGEAGFENDTGKFKIGDGATAWSDLEYTGSAADVAAAQAAAQSASDSADAALGSESAAALSASAADGAAQARVQELRDDLADPEKGAADVAFTPAGPSEPSLSLRDAVTRASSSGRSGTVAFVFDDGYRSNYLYALPIFRRYGFAATMAMEMERIGGNYNGDPNYPVCNGADMRALIAAGWEICNHPALTLSDSEGAMVAKARSEHAVLRAALTEGGLYPEFANYPVTSVVYRGGARNATSDLAYRYLYDKVRSINGPIADRGDYLYVMGQGAERTTQMSAFPVDTTSTTVQASMAFLESVAQTNATAIIYAHDTPSGPGGATPHISEADLDRLLRHCRDLGLAVVPLARLYKGNAIADTRFDLATGSFGTRSGDVAQFSSTDTLNGADRCVVMTSSAPVANLNTRYTTSEFVVEPFCRYRIRVRYKIDADLVLQGGEANRNHGLAINLETSTGNTANNGSSAHSAHWEVINSTSDRLPYKATSGYEEWSIVLVTGRGARALVRAGLYNCTGTVRVGQIVAERLDSVIDLPLSGKVALSTTTFARVYLPSPSAGSSRPWEWDVTATAAAVETTATYNYAFSDSASVPTPSEGQTCYVIGVGAGAFAGQSGKLATYTSGSWAFSTIPSGSFFTVSNAEGVVNRRFRHRGASPIRGALYEEFYAPVIPEVLTIKRQSGGEYRIYNSSGNRTDDATWVARPRAG